VNVEDSLEGSIVSRFAKELSNDPFGLLASPVKPGFDQRGYHTSSQSKQALIQVPRVERRAVLPLVPDSTPRQEIKRSLKSGEKEGWEWSPESLIGSSRRGGRSLNRSPSIASSAGSLSSLSISPEALVKRPDRALAAHVISMMDALTAKLKSEGINGGGGYDEGDIGATNEVDFISHYVSAKEESFQLPLTQVVHPASPFLSAEEDGRDIELLQDVHYQQWANDNAPGHFSGAFEEKVEEEVSWDAVKSKLLKTSNVSEFFDNASITPAPKGEMLEFSSTTTSPSKRITEVTTSASRVEGESLTPMIDALSSSRLREAIKEKHRNKQRAKIDSALESLVAVLSSVKATGTEPID